jgi:hypothetical protein
MTCPTGFTPEALTVKGQGFQNVTLFACVFG